MSIHLINHKDRPLYKDFKKSISNSGYFKINTKSINGLEINSFIKINSKDFSIFKQLFRKIRIYIRNKINKNYCKIIEFYEGYYDIYGDQKFATIYFPNNIFKKFFIVEIESLIK